MLSPQKIGCFELQLVLTVPRRQYDRKLLPALASRTGTNSAFAILAVLVAQAKQIALARAKDWPLNGMTAAMHQK